MDVMEAIRSRHSIRSFSDKAVDESQLSVLIEAASAAPSARNSQPWRFHIATGEVRGRVNEVMALSTVYLSELLELSPEVLELAERFYANLGGAPVVIAVSLPSEEDATERTNACISAGAAIENIMLAATSLGLGACNITFPHWVRDQLIEVFGIAEGRDVVSLLLIGEPAGEPLAPEHRSDVATILK